MTPLSHGNNSNRTVIHFLLQRTTPLSPAGAAADWQYRNLHHVFYHISQNYRRKSQLQRCELPSGLTWITLHLSQKTLFYISAILSKYGKRCAINNLKKAILV